MHHDISVFLVYPGYTNALLRTILRGWLPRLEISGATRGECAAISGGLTASVCRLDFGGVLWQEELKGFARELQEFKELGCCWVRAHLCLGSRAER